ncbi:MAG TPA: SDR family oxidoreductase [Steroidobacteraceae bacterium]|nr:SDR family oxidoreductase [Steroidobacteraceae bacterium]
MSEAVHPEFAQGVAIVFGGSGGIGSAICTTLADMGSNVVLTYKTRVANAEQVAVDVRRRGKQAHAVQLDIEDANAVKSFVGETASTLGPIHSVVYAAGPALEFLYINEIAPEEWARVINGDVNACFNVVAAVLPHLRAQRGGALVAVVTAAVDRSPPRDILSAAPKAAIQMLIRGVAREEGRSGIRANCVGPGYIEAGLGLTTVHSHTADYVQRMVKAVPLRRAGQAQDVANAVCFLLSNKASYISGETICVAGGLQIV